ncbi:MAG: Maf family protein [Ilumatobacteraceae bacterium]
MADHTTPLAHADIVLASRSPRRVELLTQFLDHACGEGVVSFAIEPADLDESPLDGETPTAHVRRLALAKARAVAERFTGERDVVVIGSDTTVDVDGEIFGQPVDTTDARRMLKALSSRTHRVHTAVAVIRGGRVAETLETSLVTMVPITDELLEWYLGTGESVGKAGSYAVQGEASILVERVVGSTSAVIGLPLGALSELLANVGFSWKIGA